MSYEFKSSVACSMDLAVEQLNVGDRLMRLAIIFSAFAMFACASTADAQDGGLLYTVPPQFGPPLTVENSSFTYAPLPPDALPQELKIEDIITVLVDYRSATSSEGQAQSRKNAIFNSVLTEWLAFDGKSIFSAPQSRGDPAVAGTLNSQYRAQGDLELRESLTFRIAAKIVDIRPNGNLVIEAHRQIEINDEQWEASLTGIVDRNAILPDNTVRSDAVADLKIHKRELGQVRNSYSPGWFNWWWGRHKPF